MSFFSQSPRIGRRASMPGQMLPGSANFSPGQFASRMPAQNTQPQQPPTAQPPMAVAMSAPPAPKTNRSSNAQLSTNTPLKADPPAPQAPLVFQPPAPTGPPYPQPGEAPPGSRWDPQRGVFVTYNGSPNPPAPEAPVEQGSDPVTPVQEDPRQPRYPRRGEKAPDFVSSMELKAQQGTLRIQDVLAARQAGNDALAEAILQALAGNGWNYVNAPRMTTPGFVPPPMASIYDRPGGNPNLANLPDVMARKAQTGQLTAVDALEAERSGDIALATSIRNAVAGLGWQYPPGETARPGDGTLGIKDGTTADVQSPPQQTPPGTVGTTRRYRVFTSPSAGGIYTG